ncbi:hypothetical protein RHMOL_Rhmol03G0139800 [Rhododendron molle]|uniref:Uncharacterized protein n=1 Tax=Rhododendron molle TaxID=49168 RepID=A0ACC0PEB3_RHOML|nr:hypothetical protein RHMOL_Rhmol03G0139800 [Rhododendron molle]
MFTMEKDDEMRLTHCFWADATARKSYQYFGDVMVFDTTYNTNRYRMIFAPILGVNHHRQTTLFGCGLLSDESSEFFEWLFKEWFKAMPGGPPKMIITDQDPAMTKAFANVLPTTHHRYCIWHIVSKFSEKISALSYKDHYDEFKQCIWNSESPKEFEATWADVGHRANLSSNEWLKAMRNKLFKLASSVIDDAVLTKDGSELLEDALCSVRNKLCAMNLGREGGNLTASASQVSIPREHIFKEPLQVRVKGFCSSLDFTVSDDKEDDDDDDDVDDE